MKQLIQLLLILTAGLVCTLQSFAQPFHSLSLQPSTGGTALLQTYASKTVLVVTTARDTAVSWTGLAALQTSYPDLVVIELPVRALTKATDTAAYTFSASTVHGREVTDSTSTNGLLLQWLTKKEGNTHFVVSNLQVGQRFFVDGTGKLYAVMPGDFAFTDPRMNAILTKTPITGTE